MGMMPTQQVIMVMIPVPVGALLLVPATLGCFLPFLCFLLILYLFYTYCHSTVYAPHVIIFVVLLASIRTKNCIFGTSQSESAKWR